MVYVLSTLLHVFDAIQLMLCLAVMAASWPTGSLALSLGEEEKGLLSSGLTPS